MQELSLDAVGAECNPRQLVSLQAPINWLKWQKGISWEGFNAAARERLLAGVTQVKKFAPEPRSVVAEKETVARRSAGAKKDTRGGGIGCRALRLLREESLAGMQILAGTPPRVWAFA